MAKRANIQTGILSLILLAACGTASGSTPALAKEGEGEGKPDKADFDAALKLFQQYKQLDKDCNAKLVDLYAPDAVIESEVERKNTPAQKEKYDREKYGKLITKTFADPNMAKISATTQYDEPTVKREGHGKKDIELDFHAYQGDTAMKVKWILHRAEGGDWRIVKEKALTYRKSVGPKSAEEKKAAEGMKAAKEIHPTAEKKGG